MPLTCDAIEGVYLSQVPDGAITHVLCVLFTFDLHGLIPNDLTSQRHIWLYGHIATCTGYVVLVLSFGSHIPV